MVTDKSMLPQLKARLRSGEDGSYGFAFAYRQDSPEYRTLISAYHRNTEVCVRSVSTEFPALYRGSISAFENDGYDVFFTLRGTRWETVETADSSSPRD